MEWFEEALKGLPIQPKDGMSISELIEVMEHNIKVREKNND